MKRVRILLVVSILCFCVLTSCFVKTAVSSRKKIIFDTDFGSVYDDAGALAVLHSLADMNEAQILATVCNIQDNYGVGALCSVNKYFGREGIPVGGVTVMPYLNQLEAVLKKAND
jgi:inosine-uridine nucleoside N-ribohydrolase